MDVVVDNANFCECGKFRLYFLPVTRFLYILHNLVDKRGIRMQQKGANRLDYLLRKTMTLAYHRIYHTRTTGQKMR
jgi:hypothetical protein